MPNAQDAACGMEGFGVFRPEREGTEHSVLLENPASGD
jgi:hypothetical protein